MQATFRVRRFPMQAIQIVLVLAIALILATFLGFWLRSLATPTVTTAAVSQAVAQPAGGVLSGHKATVDDGQQPRSTGIQY